MPRLTSLSGAQVAVLFDDPLGIVEFDEVADGVPQLRDVAVDATMDDLFLQRAIEPLGDAVGLGLGDEGVGRLDAPELDLVGEVVRQILGAVIHPQGQPPSRAGRGRAIQPGKPHGDRLQGGEAVAALADSLRVRELSGRIRRAAALLAVAALLGAFSAPALAQTEVPAGWSLKPEGLAAGGQFRLLFLSSTKRSSTSTNIADYNTFIQNLAAAGHADIQAYSAGFKAVGCTSAVDARDNTGTTGAGVPIYWLNGAKAADNYADFYDGSWDDEVNDKNEAGTDGPDTSQSGNYPLTGCGDDGTENISPLGTLRPLGAPGPIVVSVGRPNSSGGGPIGSNFTVSKTNTRPMYGLSEVFQVAAAANNPPAFSADTADRSVAENTAAGQDVGAVLTALDGDGDTLTYTLEGADAALVPGFR